MGRGEFSGGSKARYWDFSFWVGDYFCQTPIGDPACGEGLEQFTITLISQDSPQTASPSVEVLHPVGLWSNVLEVSVPWSVGPFSPLTFSLSGTLVSPKLMRGEFYSPEGNGFWTASPYSEQMPQNGNYSIKVAGAQVVVYTLSFDDPERGVWPRAEFAHPTGSSVWVQVSVEYYENGQLLLDEWEREHLSLVDSEGHETPALAMRPGDFVSGTYDVLQRRFTPTGYTVYFYVCGTCNGFKLRYRDLPLVDLGF